jgi:hypothetical protein
MTNKETRKRAKKTGKMGEIKTCKGREKIGKGCKKTGMRPYKDRKRGAKSQIRGCNHRQGGLRKYRQWCVKRR